MEAQKQHPANKWVIQGAFKKTYVLLDCQCCFFAVFSCSRYAAYHYCNKPAEKSNSRKGICFPEKIQKQFLEYVLFIFGRKVRLQPYRNVNMGTKLQEKRIKKGWSQERLARKSKINIRTIQDYEQQHRDINKAKVGTVRKLAEALGCTIEELLD